MKKLLLIALLPLMMLFEVSLVNDVQAQMSTVEIGTSASTTNVLPFNMGYKNSYNQMVYYRSEITETGYIGAISFAKSGDYSRTVSEITVWMALTADSMNTDTSWVPESAMKQVFHATNFVIPESSGDMMLVLDSSFYYDGTQNLAIMVSRKDNGKQSSVTFECTNTHDNSCLYRRKDFDPSYGNHPGIAKGTLTSVRPDVKLYMSSSNLFCFPVSKVDVIGVSENSIKISWPSVEGASGYEVAYVESSLGNDISTAVPAASVDTTYTFMGLDANTTYIVGARKICSGGMESDWVSTVVTTTDTPLPLPFSADFETADSRMAWNLDNGELENKWVINTEASCGESSTYGMYISNDSTSYEYTTSNQAGTVFAKCLLNFDVAGDYNIGYDWKCMGQKSSDYMRAFLVPAMYGEGLTASESLPSGISSSRLPEAYIPIDGGSELVSKSDWQHYLSVIDIPVAGNYYLVYMWRNNSSSGSIPPAAVDNIVVELAFCPSIDSVVVDSITTTSVRITGHNSDSVNTYKLYYRVWGSEAYDTLDITSPYVLQNLNPSTSYEGVLRASCDDGDSYETIDFQFGTECEGITLPWAFGAECSFMKEEEGDGEYPYCWSLINGNTAAQHWKSTPASQNVHTGDVAIYFKGSYAQTTFHNDWLITPAITFTGSEEMSFWVRTTSASTNLNFMGRFALYASDATATSVTDTAHFTQLSITGTNVESNSIEFSGNTWQKITVQLPNTLVGVHNLAFVVRNVNSYDFCLDDLYLYTKTTCGLPDSTRVTALTSSSATVAWNGEAESYTVYYGEPGFDYTEAPAISATTNSCEITGLEANTTYEYRIMATCSDGVASSLSYPATFTTTCDPISIDLLPFLEDFSDNATGSKAELDDCWYKGTNSTTPYPYVTALEDNNCLYFYSHTKYYSYVALPAFEEDLNNLILSCRIRRATTDRQSSDLVLGLMANPNDMATFTAYDTLRPVNLGEWSDFVVSLANYNTEEGLYLTFVLPKGQLGFAHLDDIQLMARGACDSPTDPSIVATTATTAIVSWADDEANSWSVYYGEPGFSIDTVSNPIGVTDTHAVEIAGLMPQTTYEFVVVSDCVDGGNSAPSVAAQFTTACAPIDSLPYIETFEAYETGSSASIDPCWYKRAIGVTTDYPYPATFAAITDSIGLYFYSRETSNSKYNCYAALPMFTEPLNNLIVKFKMMNKIGITASANYPATLCLGVMSNPEDLTTFDTLATFNMGSFPDGTVNTYEYSFNNYAGEGQYITFLAPDVARGNFDVVSNMFCIDDIVVDRIPNCQRPTDLVATSVAATTADFTWSGNASSYEIAYSLHEDMSDSTSIIVSTNSATLTNLTSYTYYYVNVRGLCDGNETSEWMLSPIMIMTTMDCGEGFEQFVDTIGDGTFSSSQYVLNGSTKHHDARNWTIFTSEEMAEMGLIGNNNIIKAISLYVDGMGTAVSFRVYMAETSVEEFTTALVDTMALNQMTMVYDNTLNFVSNSWNELVLQTPFTYSDTNNLMIAFERTADVQSTIQFAYTKCNRYRSAYTYNTTTINSHARKLYRGNMIFNICGDVPTCIRPLDIEKTNLTSDAVSLAWTGTATSYQIAYDTLDFDPSSVALADLVSVTGTSVILQNLLPNTTYYIYLRSVCEGEHSSWSNVIQVTTPCAPVALPYSENFDSYPAGTYISSGQTIDPCWTKGTNYTSAYPHLYTSFSASAPNSMNFYGSPNHYSYAALPMFTEPINTLAVSFNLHKTSPNYGTLHVGVMVDPNDISTFQRVATVQPTVTKVWEPFEVSFANYTGSGKFIAFMAPDSITSNAELDDVEVYEIPTCPAPINVMVDSITTTTALVSWTDRAINPSAGYEIEYGPQGYEVGTGTTVASSQNPCHLTNLAVGTTYDIYVRALCSATDYSHWTPVVTFSTNCGPIALPVTYDFEHDGAGSTAELPHCFSRYCDIIGGEQYPYVSSSTSNAHSGSKYLYWNMSNRGLGYQNAVMVFPEVDTLAHPMDNNQMIFWGKRGTAVAEVIVGVMRSPSMMNTFVAIDTIALTSDYTEYTVAFDSYIGNGTYPAIRMVRPNNNVFVYIDDVTIESMPSCPRVFDLRSVTATANSITIDWTDTIGTAQWIVDYHKANSDAIQTLNATTHPYTVTGLDVTSQYYFNVRPICASGDTAAACEEASFWTTQVPATIPYNYDFEEATEWNNWQTNSNGTLASNVNWYRGTAIAGQGTHAMYISSDEGATNSTYWKKIINAAAYRDIDFGTDTSSFTMIFKANVGGTIDHECDGLSVLLVDPTQSVDSSNMIHTTPWGSVSEVALTTIRHDTTWGTYLVHFEHIAGIHRVAFNWYNQAIAPEYNYINRPAAIDSISIIEQTCYRPHDLSVSDIDATIATLHWSGEVSNYEVIYREADAEASSEVHQVVAGNSYNLVNLNPDTEYLFWVRAICGAGDTSFRSDAYHFSTICSRYDASYMISEDFSDWDVAHYDATNGVLPDCWEGYSSGVNGVLPHVIGGGPFWYAHSAKSLVMTAGKKSTYGNVAVVRMPYTVQPVHTLTLSYWMATESATEGTLEVGYLTGDNLATDFVAIKTINASGVTEHAGLGNQTEGVGLYDTVNFRTAPGNAQSLAFRWTYDTLHCSVCLDDIVITSEVTCPAPIINSTVVDHESVVVTWRGEAPNYQLCYKEYDANVWSDTILVTGNTYTIPSLLPETTYNLMVRALCGAEDGNSVWSEATFTTLPFPCDKPTQLTVTRTDHESVTLKWNANEEAQRWVVNIFDQTDSRMDTVEANPVTISGLYADITYHAAVKSLCTDLYSSEWSDTVTFVTTACQAVENITVTNITRTSAKVQWSAAGEEAAWQLNYGPQGFGQNEGEMADVTATNYTLTNLESETAYDVYVRAMCSEDFYSVWSDVVTFTTLGGQEGIDGVEGNFQFAIYPNPTSNATTISLNGVEGKVVISVVDMNGRTVANESIECGVDCEKRIDVTNLAQGTYFVRVLGDNINSVRKLIVR